MIVFQGAHYLAKGPTPNDPKQLELKKVDCRVRADSEKERNEISKTDLVAFGITFVNESRICRLPSLSKMSC